MVSEEKLRKKIKKYSEKLERRKRRRERSHSRLRRHTTTPRGRSRSRSPTWEQSPVPPSSVHSSISNIEDLICHSHTEETQTQAAEPINLDSPTRELEPANQIEKEPNEELLLALGDDYESNKRYEGEINKDICKRWDYILMNGLSKAEKEEIMKNNILPHNCQLLDAPVLNEEVRAVISEVGRSRDRVIAGQQKQMGTALAIIGEIMSKIIKNNFYNLEIIKSLGESAKLLTDIHYQNTKTRRTLVAPQLDKTFLEMMENTKRNQFLYGDNLCEKIKTSKQIQQSSNSIKKAQPKQVNPSKNNSKTNKYSGNRSGPPQPANLRQPARTMARGGPRSRTAQPSQYKRSYNSQHPERGRGACYNNRR